MENQDKISWSALEYEEKERGNDWFWALGIIVVAGATTSFIYENYFFGLFLVIGGLLLGFFATKKPDLIDYELNERGIKIKNQIFPYKEMKAFWIQYNGEKHPTLFIHSDRIFIPIVSIPLTGGFEEEVIIAMLDNDIKEEEMREHASEKILNFLGF
ncbi:MAG: hypothetical protein AAB873_01095 [Patescibacteria group bacterium]